MAKSLTILDGGMGRELKSMGAPFAHIGWSAIALTDTPDLVAQAHANFIEAGADVITTNAYAVVPPMIGADKFARQGPEIAELAAHLAKAAANEADRDIRVAASLPPLFGSYEPENFNPALAPEQWKVLIKAQDEHCDIWLQETISSVVEFETCHETVKANQDFNRPYWASFTIADELVDGLPVLRSGESISQLGRAVNGKVESVLINCAQPEVVSVAVEMLCKIFDSTSVEVGAYANAFSEEEDDEGFSKIRNDLEPSNYLKFAEQWVEAGATIVGGCCGIGPAHIEKLVRNLEMPRI